MTTTAASALYSAAMASDAGGLSALPRPGGQGSESTASSLGLGAEPSAADLAVTRSSISSPGCSTPVA
jgi:hypothetical protein